MEILNRCRERAWRARLHTGDLISKEWIDHLRVDAGFDSAVWSDDIRGGWILEGPREYATDADPLVDVRVRHGNGQVSVEARLDERVTTISNVPSALPTDPDWRCGDLVCLASPRETVELAMRWILAWGHCGCVDLGEFAFWDHLTTATAFAIAAPDRWLAGGAPLPGAAGAAVFVACCGSKVRLRAVADVVDCLAQQGDERAVGGGVFPSDESDVGGTYALVAVVSVDAGHDSSLMPADVAPASVHGRDGR